MPSPASIAAILTNAVVGTEQPDLATLAAVPLIVVLGKVIGLYDRQESVVRKSTLDEAPVLFQLATLYAVAIWLINGLLITRTNSRRELLVNWFALFVLLLLFRVLARAVSRRATTPERCLIIGDRPTCDRIRVKLALRRSLHACVVACVQIDALADERHGMAVLSDDRDLAALVNEHRVDRIIIAPAGAEGDDVLNVIRAANSLGVKVSIVPRLLEVVGSSVEFDEVEGVPLLSMRSVRLSRSSQLVKRALDVTASIVGLVIFTPALVVIAAAIKLDSRGPLLFRQSRVGRDGEVFEMLKFRTMVDGAEHQREALRHLNEADGLFKIADDPRITRVGAALRRTSLDELPQLWNVLRRRHEPCRAAASRGRRGRPHPWLAPSPAAVDPGNDRTLADPRLCSYPPARDGEHRLSVRNELVIVERHQDLDTHNRLCRCAKGDLGGDTHNDQLPLSSTPIGWRGYTASGHRSWAVGSIAWISIRRSQSARR